MSALKGSLNQVTTGFIALLMVFMSTGLYMPPARAMAEVNEAEQLSSTLSVSELPVRLSLSLSERMLFVYQGDRLLHQYPVAVGREGWQTPVGEFSVFQKEQDPIWQHPLTGEIVPPGPYNPLGTRWIGFWSDGVNAIGFHGTPDESVIGSAVSHGCVRMRHDDVVALFEQVELDTVVVVTP